MKIIQIKFIVFLSLIMAFSQWSSAQDSATNELKYEVNRIYPYLSITKENLNKAKSINEFKDEANGQNLDYKPSWVKDFISVTIFTSIKGETKKAVSKTDQLNQEQKDIMNNADTGADIIVYIQYIPENTLSDNTPKEARFKFTVIPDNEARYKSGQKALNTYIKENAIDKIPQNTYKGYDLTAIKFSINEGGEIVDIHVFEEVNQTSIEDEINDLLVAAIKNMPSWDPATYANGTKVKQNFVLTVGNMENCSLHLLNLHK